MNITKELVKRVAEQSMLNLTDSEIEKLIPQLKEILETFSQLDKVDTKNVKPSFHPIEIKNISYTIHWNADKYTSAEKVFHHERRRLHQRAACANVRSDH